MILGGFLGYIEFYFLFLMLKIDTCIFIKKTREIQYFKILNIFISKKSKKNIKSFFGNEIFENFKIFF